MIDQNLVTTDGLPLLGEGQTLINIPFKTTTDDGEAILTEIKVDNDGTIEATYGLDTTNIVGKISLADFVNEFDYKILVVLISRNRRKWKSNFCHSKEGTLGKLQAGFLEKSNTDITDEIIHVKNATSI